MKGPIHHTLSEGEILFLRIRDACLKHPYRSPAFMDFVRKRSLLNGVEFHHLAGSVHGLKSTDLFGVAVTVEWHRQCTIYSEANRSKIPEALLNLFAYIEFLEEKTKRTK
jgi:hypothetical protein